MNNYKLIFVTIHIIVSFFLIPTNLWADDTKIVCSGHPDYKPFMWQHNNTIVGAGPELIRQIFIELKKEYVIEYTGPWARVQEMVQQSKIDFLVGAYKNARRLEYMTYLTPYAKDPTSVFVKKGQEFVFNDRYDLIGKKGVTMHGDSFGDDLDFFIKNKLNVARVYDSTSLFKKMMSQRMDYILWGDFPCRINAAMEGYDSQMIKLDPPLVVENMHITVSRKSKYTDLEPAMNRIITRKREKGQIRQLLQKYVDLYVRSQQVSVNQEQFRKMTLLVDGTLENKEKIIQFVSKQIWPDVTTGILAEDSNYYSFLSKKNTLIYTRLHLMPDDKKLEWISVDGDQGFVLHEDFDENILALWQLSYEAMKNTGTLTMNRIN
ncbi:MAG: transporter substrate-binding domain-containing protein [Desulfobacula sp.]|nr:transporter substrate-binding domain-containing protein [Desulfobacula sp.]